MRLQIWPMLGGYSLFGFVGSIWVDLQFHTAGAASAYADDNGWTIRQSEQPPPCFTLAMAETMKGGAV